MARQFKVAAIQSGAEPCAIAHNLERLDPVLEQLAVQGVELALLPEFFPTGNPLEERVLQVAIEHFAEVETWLAQRSAQLGMILAGTYVAVEAGDTYNRFAVFEPDGRRAHRHKRCSPAPETLYYTTAAGGDLAVDTGLGKIGLLMCIEMSEPELVGHDFSDCALVLVAFAIPGRFPIPNRILQRLTRVPPALAQRNGVPVVLSSMGGPFRTRGSPVMPLRLSCDYAGRSGVYLPAGPVAGPIAPGVEGTAVAEIPLGPGVAQPQPKTDLDQGVPWRVQLFDRLLLGRSRRIYRRNIRRWLA